MGSHCSCVGQGLKSRSYLPQKPCFPHHHFYFLLMQGEREKIPQGKKNGLVVRKRTLFYFMSRNPRFLAFIFICLFIFGCAGSSLLCGQVSSFCECRLLSSCDAQASHCSGFSRRRAQALDEWTSGVAAPGL